MEETWWAKGYSWRIGWRSNYGIKMYISSLPGSRRKSMRYNIKQESYLEKLQHLPGVGSIVKTEEGTGEVVNLETLKENVKVKYHDEKDDSFYFRTHNVSELEIIKRVYPEEQVNLSAEEMKELQNMEKADKVDDSNNDSDDI